MSAFMGPTAVAPPPPHCLKPTYTKFGFGHSGPDPSPFLLRFTRKRACSPMIQASYENPYCLDIVNDNGHSSRHKSGFPSTKMDFLSPNMLGIYPDPPDWPERQEINRVRVERAASRTDIPMSLRIIKKKQQQQLQMGSTEAVGSAVNTAFSSMMCIIRELQIHALQLTENRGYEEILNRVQAEMTESFVWLFRQVFAQTPTLMVYTMLLLANFSLYSMTVGPTVADTRAPIMMETYQDTVQEENRFGSDVLSRFNLSDDELTIGEAIVWNSIMEDVEEMRGEFLDEQVMRGLISPVVARPEVDESLHEEYERMDVLYQVSLGQDPTNPLLLCNYAQFLCHVTRNYNWAEELFKLAIQVEPADADAFCKYADFLWTVRKDAWAAEERYQQAIVEDPNNPHYAAKYANFLWSTGGDETCFPLDTPDDWYINPELSKSDELP